MSEGAELRAALVRLRDLFGRSGEEYWAETVSSALKERDDAALAGIVQSWFANPGALNGLVLSGAARGAGPTCAVDAVNRAFVTLRHEVFRLSLTIAEVQTEAIPD